MTNTAPPAVANRRAAGAPPSGRPARTAPQPARTRRSPLLMGIGLALTCTGGLVAAFVVNLGSDTTPVLMAARDVNAGQVLTSADLSTVELPRNAGASTVNGSELTSLIGQHVTMPLTKGQVIPPAAVAEELSPPAGRSLVGVAVTASQMPSEPIQGGDRIRVVTTPAPQAAPPPTNSAGTEAIVVSVHAVPDTAITVINVTVPEATASALAAQVATGRIAVVVLPDQPNQGE